MHIAEPVLDLLEGRSGSERDVHPAALNLENEGLASARADDLLHVGKALDRAPVDRQNEVAGLESRYLGGTAGLDGIDPRRCARSAKDHEQAGKDDDREHEIRQWYRH